MGGASGCRSLGFGASGLEFPNFLALSRTSRRQIYSCEAANIIQPYQLILKVFIHQIAPSSTARQAMYSARCKKRMLKRQVQLQNIGGFRFHRLAALRAISSRAAKSIDPRCRFRARKLETGCKHNICSPCQPKRRKTEQISPIPKL